MEKTKNKFETFILQRIQKYNHKSYWKKREYIINPNKKNKPKKLIFLLKIKKIDAFHHCSFGTNINSGAKFETPPVLPHGPGGIYISHESTIGRNVVIYQQVTIGSKIDGGLAATIGDNVKIYPKVTIVGDIKIGNNVIIGPNSVVINDIKDNCVVSGIPASIIKELGGADDEI